MSNWTYFMTYQMSPVLVIFMNLSYMMEFLSYIMNVSGSQMLSQKYTRMLFSPLVLGKENLGSRQACLRYRVMVADCTLTTDALYTVPYTVLDFILS